MAKKRRTVARKGSSPTPRVITKYKYRTEKKARRKGRRRGARRSSGTVAAAVGSAVAGAGLGALMNEAGLLQAYPTQNRTGISLVGWTGLGFLTVGLIFAKRESTKLLTYGLGGGLVTTELVRQIDMRGYDFMVAMGDAPPLTFDPTPPRLLSADETSRAEAFQLELLNKIKQQ